MAETTIRQRLIQAALELFAERGVEGTTVRDLAAAAGVADGSLYRHYPSKEALARDLLRRHARELGRELERRVARARALRQKLEAIVGCFCELFDRDPSLFRFLLVRPPAAAPESEAERPAAVVREVIAHGVGRREIPRVDPDLAAGMVIGMVVQVAVERLRGRLERRLSDLAPALTGAAWRVLRA